MPIAVYLRITFGSLCPMTRWAIAPNAASQSARERCLLFIDDQTIACACSCTTTTKTVKSYSYTNRPNEQKKNPIHSYVVDHINFMHISPNTDRSYVYIRCTAQCSAVPHVCVCGKILFMLLIYLQNSLLLRCLRHSFYQFRMHTHFSRNCLLNTERRLSMSECSAFQQQQQQQHIQQTLKYANTDFFSVYIPRNMLTLHQFYY